MEQPITERSNSITTSIDIASSTEIVQLLYEADKQMFCSDRGLLDGDVLTKLERVADAVATHLQIALSDRSGSVTVLSGCGTSGRLAFMTARSFNHLLEDYGIEEHVFEYLIAGNDDALFLSRELAEDDPHGGRQDLETITVGKKKVLFFGITCGLSAPYVAGQLDFCLNHLDRFQPVLIGFNPVRNARNAPVENWDKTFLQVARQLEHFERQEQGFIINPDVGPEPITGSTRMKSGSATKIILDAIFTSAFLRTFHNERISMSTLLSAYQSMEHVAYNDLAKLSNVVDCGGNSLRAGRHIYYVSSSETLALCGLIDASECKPTYGADLDDVRGFLVGGFSALGNRDGDLSHVVPISTEYFETDVIPRLTSDDLVVTIATDDRTYCNQSLFESTACKVILHFGSLKQSVCDVTNSSYDVVHQVMLPESVSSLLGDLPCGRSLSVLFLELACKLTCNVLTTGAHIIRGKVYENYMIDVRVSNNKLYHRAIAIVQKFGQCDTITATHCLLRCIYDTDNLSDEDAAAAISQHIRHAAERQQIVPLAILLARLHCTTQDGRRIICSCPVIRTAISGCQEPTTTATTKTTGSQERQ